MSNGIDDVLEEWTTVRNGLELGPDAMSVSYEPPLHGPAPASSGYVLLDDLVHYGPGGEWCDVCEMVHEPLLLDVNQRAYEDEIQAAQRILRQPPRVVVIPVIAQPDLSSLTAAFASLEAAFAPLGPAAQQVARVFAQLWRSTRRWAKGRRKRDWVRSYRIGMPAAGEDVHHPVPLCIDGAAYRRRTRGRRGR